MSTLATYTKITKSENFNNEEYSLGFRRYFCLSNRVKKAIQLNYLLMTRETDYHSFVVDFFNKMTEEEYKNYVITH